MDLYNRGGFCKGYYYAQNDKSMMTFDRPNHQGIVIGNIKNGELILSQEVNPGDVLEFPDGSEYTTPTGKRAEGLHCLRESLRILRMVRLSTGRGTMSF